MIPTTTAIAAIAVAVSSAIYVLSGWRSRGAVPLALGLCLAAVLEVFDLMAVKYSGSLLYWKNFAVLVEAFIPAVWVWFGLTFSRESALWKRPSHLVLQGLSLLLPVLLIYVQPAGFFYSPDFETEGVLFLSNGAFSFYMAFLAFVVAALVSLEATLTSASHGTRWKIKFQAVGVGSYLAALILYYSHSLLYRTLDMRLVPVRSAILIVATALIVYSRAQRGVGARVAVSRRMAYRSLVLLAVGIYLVVLGLLGEGMKYFGEPFHRGALVFVGFASGLILVIALLSESVRRRARVFLHKNFYRQKYDYREQWLAFTNRLASARNREELCTSVLGGFVDILAMAWGELFLRDDAGGYAPAAAYEGDAATVIFPGDAPFIKDLAGREWVVNCTEEDLALSEAQIQYLREREALFVVPLLFDGVLHGFVVLGKPVDRQETYNYEDYDLMRTLARQASSAVLNLRLSEQLAQARELEAVGRVSTFIVHDLKNLVYTLSLVVDNAREYISEPEFQEDMLSSLENTVSRMKVLISRLKKVPEKEELLPRPENLLELARETAALVAGASIIVSGEPITAPVDRDEMQKVVLNLLVNAVEATEGQGRVTLEVGNVGRPYLRVADDGCGMSEDFVKNELFVPFHTTKKKGLGIGLYQCRQIVEGHGGRIDVETALGQGAAFTVWL